MAISFEGVRVASRTLRKQPGFTSVVILSLALAIALNTTMYSVLDALIHPRIDIRNPEEIFSIKFFGDYRFKVPIAQRDSLLKASTRVVTGVAWFDAVSTYGASPLGAGDRLIDARVGIASKEYFDMMGPRLIAGRTFIASDYDAVPQPLVLNETVVSALFPPGTDPIGATVKLRDRSFKVIGVLSRYAEFGDIHADGWTLGKATAVGMFSRLVRVAPGTSRERLEQDLRIVAQRIAAAAGEDTSSVAFRVAGATKEQVRLNAMHLALIFAVVAILLVACANVANMQLARGVSRRRELALRTALGATRPRLIKHLLAESTLLASIGLILGLVLTFWGMSALKASIPPSIGEFVVETRMNWRILAFALTATLACILLVGLAPALRVSRVDPNEMLKSGAGTGATRRNRRQYGYLVVVEIAFALALLTGTAAMVRSALREAVYWPGFDPSHLTTGFVTTVIPAGQHRATSEVLAEAAQRVQNVGAVSAAADMGGDYENKGIVIADSTGARDLPVPGYSYRVVTPNYFRTMGLPIIAGRDFMDGERDVPAIIVDEFMARKLWPNATPVGSVVKLGDSRSTRPFVRIVGVVGERDRDGLYMKVDMSVASGTIGQLFYLPGAADSLVGAEKKRFVATLTGRSAGDPKKLAIDMRRAGVRAAESMDDRMGISRRKMTIEFVAKLFVLFGALGLALAAFGVYGVVAHSVAERRRELGVRIALGATSRDILHTVLREGLIIALCGAAFGLFLTRNFIGPLAAFGADIFDAPLFAGVALFMVGVAAGSAYLPARRATRVDPTESLRCE